MFSSKSSGFDKALEKATSQLLLEPDWDSILQICDCIRQGDVHGKYAIGSLKKKITADNPHVSMFALQTLESCVKNCGSIIHEEVATKEFMEFLKDIAKTKPDPVKGKICELIQCWSHAFRNEPNYKVVQDTFNLMKMEGYTFPTLKEADAMFMAEKAPEWKEGDACARCRTRFGTFNRQHHCRSCGDVFCGKCSSKSSIIPKFGIEREVRVCDSCFDKIQQPIKKKDSDSELPAEYLASPLSKQQQIPPQKSEQEIQEEEELQLALALSQSENEAKEKERERLKKNYGMYGGNTNTTASAPATQPTVSAPVIDTTDMDPELARYLDRNFWQRKSNDNKQTVTTSTTTTPSAPVANTEPKQAGGGIVMEAYQNGADEGDQEQFLRALQSSLEIFVNRMKSNSQRGRSIANDSSVQSLFNVISNMHPQLMKYTQEQEDMRGHYESLQDKLAQLRDAREALDALREDYREKKRREQEELERQRQIQMAQKLEIMRQKKHEYLEMQRQLALQRLQDQEREMQMRLEQQKHLTQIRQMQAYGYPPNAYGQMPPMQGMQGQTFSPINSVDGSPVHQMHQNMYPPPMGVGPGNMNVGSGQGMPQMQGGMNMGMGPSGGGMGPSGGSMGPSGGSMGPSGGSMGPSGGGLDQQTMMNQGPMGTGLPQMYAAPSSQAGGPYPPGSTQPVNLPGTYQTEAGQNNYQPQMQYSMSPPMNQGYMPPPNIDYKAFNMQSMANALPPQNQQGMYSAPSGQQQYMTGPPHQSQQYQQGGPPPQQAPQQPPPAPTQLEGELISFD
ncbi:hepatocyte growth factor-regulated tyrosine kinase substrate-like [Ostrea edulis]|uniref:hepatocyte growth factor-regulated tyrosine kinase substrate-like n=1 Tax=Ostrea edulis TaxID=37623 RepID=UPI0024AEE009|nr:hepatocyte growth factor-regulated tyrosine kinase substrate-like [Ostrea edulis]